MDQKLLMAQQAALALHCSGLVPLASLAQVCLGVLLHHHESKHIYTTLGYNVSAASMLLHFAGILAPSKLGGAFNSGPSSASVSPASTSPVSTPGPCDGKSGVAWHGLLPLPQA